MNMHKQKLLERAGAYSEFKKTRDAGLGKLKDILAKFSEVSPEADVCIQDNDDCSLRFRIFGFSVYVRFLINITNDIGCVQWYHISFEPEKQKGKAELILEHYFDYLGNLYKHRTHKTSSCSFSADYWSFAYQNIFEFCEKVDRGEVFLQTNDK